MMRKCGRRNLQLLLHFTRNHSGRMSREQQPQNRQARFGTKRGKAIRRSGDQEWMGFLNISIVAEIWKHCQSFFSTNALPIARIQLWSAFHLALEMFGISLLTVLHLRGILSF